MNPSKVEVKLIQIIAKKEENDDDVILRFFFKNYKIITIEVQWGDIKHQYSINFTSDGCGAKFSIETQGLPFNWLNGRCITVRRIKYLQKELIVTAGNYDDIISYKASVEFEVSI